MTHPFSAVRTLCLFAAIGLGLPSILHGQTRDTLYYELSEVEIEAARAAETEVTSPFAVALRARPLSAIRHNPAPTLDAVMNDIPGVWINNRENAALGERLSIRGMGWSTAFGVRGVQVLLDGIPLTSPDGQTVLTLIDPAFVRNVEVIRGPSSAFWGNASGGTVFLSTRHGGEAPVARLRTIAGSYGMYKTEVEAGHRTARGDVNVSASRFYYDGYRNHSRTEIWRAFAHGRYVMGARTSLAATAAYVDAPVSQHPGSLTLDQAREDPRQANPLFVNTASGKDSRQGQLGLTLDHATGVGILTATAYGLIRELHNPLPFGYVSFDRTAGGLRIALQERSGNLRWGIGADASVQRDDRLNRNNVEGRPGGEVSLDQLEHVYNTAIFGRVARESGPATLSAGLRYDRLHFTAEDRLIWPEDHSGSRTFSALSPTIGFTYAAGRSVVFANFSTAFKAPTTTELVNRPDLQGGFNPDLGPERALGMEAGSRGTMLGDRVYYDVAAFFMQVSDLLVPFQTPRGGPERVFYRNEGNTRHNGIEAYVAWMPNPRVRLSAGYALSDFVFVDGPFQGNRLPGIPPHRAHGELRLNTPGGVVGLIRSELVSGYHPDSANEHRNPAYTLVDLQLGHDNLRLGGDVAVQPLVRVNNVFDTFYSGSVSINVAGNRFFEPGAGRNLQAGINVSWR